MKKLRLAIIVGCTIILGWLLYLLCEVFIPYIFAFILALLLDPLVKSLEGRGLTRRQGIIVAFLLTGTILIASLYFALPVITLDLNMLVEKIPGYADSIQDTLQELQVGYQKVTLPEAMRQVTDQLIAEGESLTLRLIQGIMKGIVALFSQAFNLVLAPILSYYLLLEFKAIGQILLSIVPVRYRGEMSLIGTEISFVMKRFIQGNLLVAFLVGILAATGLTLIGMDYPLLLGIIVGITNFIPYFGAILAAIPAVFLALLKSKWLALYVLGLMLFIQQIEGNIISPKILGESVGLHPLIVILVLLVGGELFGLLGLLLAVPFTAILKIILQHVFKYLI